MKKFWAVLGVVGLSATMAVGAAQAATFTTGDVFASVDGGAGSVQQWSAAGVLKDTLNSGVSGFNTGSAFDTSGNLYVTEFSGNSVSKFAGPTDPHTVSSFGGGYSTPEAIVFNAAGDAYVGNLSGGIRHFNAAGTFLGNVLGTTRVDWMDLAANQTTMLYSQEGTAIHTVNVVTGVSGADFTTLVGHAFALRILADGSVLVADNDNIKRISADGLSVLQTYNTVSPKSTWFSLNLNNDGTSFWSGTFSDGILTRFDIATGAVLQTINTGMGGSTLYGVSVFGEVTQGCGANCGGGGGTVPEPASLILLGSGLAALGLRRLNKA